MATNQLLSAIMAAGNQSQQGINSSQMSPVSLNNNFGSANSFGNLPIQSAVGGNGGGNHYNQ
jgi:hypothetical protein